MRWGGLLPWVVLLVTGISIFQSQQQYAAKHLENSRGNVDYFLEEKKIKMALLLRKKMPTFGYNNILADWYYLRFIQYFGDSPAREKTGYSAVADYFELISDYDPRFVDAYLILSTANSIYAGQAPATVKFLNKVLANISPEISPYAPYLWIYKGVDEMLFLGDIKAAKHSYEMAAKWALARGDEVGKEIAKRSLETAAFLGKNPDSRKARAGAWYTIFKNVFDEETKEKARLEVEKVGGKIVVLPDGSTQLQLPEED
ncbi:MAG: hypothetical protein NZ901_10860 [Geminocystis sp.]|nr:hypothetical protein [Geminocystis sp.]MCX8078204.1 hypothetical protein [Geminocystis sp.]HIK38188.1 hypothetical protein [Geminocystis sp. M7585_C2015_104]